MTPVKDDRYALIGLYILSVVALLWWLCSCSTRKSIETSTDIHHTELAVQRMDSLMHFVTTWQQNAYERQTSLIDSIRHSEVRDTSRTYFLGVRGDTVREIIRIKEIVEREHSSQENQTEWREMLFRQNDSIISVNKTMEQKLDSVISSRQKVTEVVKEPSFFEKMKLVGIGLLIAAVIVLLYCIRGKVISKWY